MAAKPHQAAYWEVDLPLDPELRAARRDWCRLNVAAVPNGLPWISPRQPTEDGEFGAWWRGDPGATETWRFARHEDAVLFEMVWRAATWARER